MNDQATTLRRLSAGPVLRMNVPAAEARQERPSEGAARTVAITSGKGGVGKTNVAVNLALELAARGRRVTLLDADLGLANADVLIGLNPHYHLGHVLSGQRDLEGVVVDVADGVRLIPGGSGVEELANLSLDQHSRLLSELRAMEQAADFMLVDTASGIAGNVTGVLRAASEVVIVTTPDPTAVVDAYATIKVLHQHAPDKPISIVVNNVVGVGDAEQIYSQLRAAARRFLGHDVSHLGMIPRDPELAEAVREQVPVVLYAPNAPSSRALRLIAKHLIGSERPGAGTPASFWCSLAELQD